eukprot:3806824-Rhodomonas_salina.1
METKGRKEGRKLEGVSVPSANACTMRSIARRAAGNLLSYSPAGLLSYYSPTHLLTYSPDSSTPFLLSYAATLLHTPDATPSTDPAPIEEHAQSNVRAAETMAERPH